MSENNPLGYRIYNYTENFIDEEQLPYDLDFKTGLSVTLHKVTYPLLQGEPTHVIYYSDATKTEEVCRIDFTIIRYDAANPGEESLDGFIKQKIAALKWYRNDGTLSTEFKDLGRFFLYPDDIQLMINEGVQKRSLIYENLKANVLGMLQATLGPTGANTHTLEEAKQVGVDYVATEKAAFDNYVDTYNTTIIDDITNDTTNTWLDNVINPSPLTTIRQYMINELDLG